MNRVNLTPENLPSSVDSHLDRLQEVIKRMATNSRQCKTWCITIISAILVVVADKSSPDLAWVSLLPAILFFFLDAYYLAFEKGFRESYNSLIAKIHTNT